MKKEEVAKDTSKCVNNFLSLFDRNLKYDVKNTYLPKKLDFNVLLVQTISVDLEDSELMDLRPVPRLSEYEFLKRRTKTCYIIGGGKSLEFFDFDKLRERREHDSLVIGVNAGSCYFESDVIFYSGSVTITYKMPDGNTRPLAVNGGLLEQFPHAYIEGSQVVIVPFSFQSDDPVNLDTVRALQVEHSIFVENFDYSDLWATKKLNVGWDTFYKSLKKSRLYGMGPDFGFMAICCAIIWGASKIFLIGFDGRFMEMFHTETEMVWKDFLNTMWVGDQNMYSYMYEGNVTPEQYDFCVVQRNRINKSLFHFLKRYCKKYRILLNFLTPSIYATKDNYFEL